MSQLDRIELGIMNLVQAQKDRNHALVEENAALKELEGLLDCEFGECVYCGKRDIPINTLDHWLECPSHPAHSRIAALDRIIKAWEEGRVFYELSAGGTEELVAITGSLYRSFATPAEAYAALEDDDD